MTSQALPIPLAPALHQAPTALKPERVNSNLAGCRYSFGTANQVLPVPELAPFRLTRQMCGVLAPHDALAVLAAPMGAALHALRGGADILEV